jgi:purine-binding chemotaxis protein CheW
MAQYSSFHLGDGIYGIDILGIQEILRHLEVTPVPNAPAFVDGLINLRGQIAVVVNLRKRLGMPPARPDNHPIHIIADVDGEVISLLADRAGDVFEFDPQALAPCPGQAGSGDSALVQGVFQLESGLLHVLDARTLMGAAARPAESQT